MSGRVAFITMHTCPLLQPGSGWAGGMNVYVDELARYLARDGIGVDVFTRRHARDVPGTVVVEKGYVVHHIDAGPPSELDPMKTARYVEGFAGRVSEIVSHSPHIRLVHSHYWLSGWAGLRIKQVLGLPHVHSFHTLGRITDKNRRADSPPQPLERLAAEQEVIDETDRIIASTEAEKADLVTHYGADPKDVCVAPPGVDHDLFTPGLRPAARIRLGWPDVPTVLFAGRIQPVKGPDVVIEAFQKITERIDDARLVLVGAPTGAEGAREYEALQLRAKKLDLADKVTFAEPVPHRQMADVYRASNLVMVPSRSESFGLVAAEAQASGVPVLGARVGGLAAVLADGSGGVLLDDWDPDNWAVAALEILTNQQYAAELGTRGSAWAERFSWEASAQRILDIYREML